MSAFPAGVSFDEAAAILDRVGTQSRLAIEDCTLSRALGRVLAEDLVAPIDLPQFDNSAMDGFAVRAADLSDGVVLRLVGERFAGGAASEACVGEGDCLRITTGAPMPAGADTVVVKENCRVEGNRVHVQTAPVAAANVRRAAEDVCAGQVVLQAGCVLTPAALGLAAALGQPSLRIHRRPTVALFTTGDELRPPGSALAPGEIFDSNRVLLQTLLLAEGLEPVAWPVLPDDPARIEVAMRDAADAFDLVITCGGVSAGEKDFLPALMSSLGTVHLWKVRMRPGMPLLVAQVEQCQFLCLPGNPVSVMATFLTLGRRLLDAMQGRREPRPRRYAKLSGPLKKRHERREFLRGRLECDESGQWNVMPNPADGSHRLRAAAEADALIVVPEGAGEWVQGSVMEVLPLPGA